MQLAYTCYGQVEAPVHLLLIHGLFDDQRTWQYLLPHLRHGDRYMVTVDLLGAGLSSTPHLATTPATHRYDADLHVKQLRQLIAELSLRNLVLMGSSLGGGLALRMLCTPWPDRPAMVGLIDNLDLVVKGEIARLTAELKGLQVRYLDKHPEVAAVKQRLASLTRATRKEIQRPTPFVSSMAIAVNRTMS